MGRGGNAAGGLRGFVYGSGEGSHKAVVAGTGRSSVTVSEGLQ